MNLDELIKRNYELCTQYPSITDETKVLNMYWMGYISYDEYQNKLREIKESKKESK